VENHETLRGDRLHFVVIDEAYAEYVTEPAYPDASRWLGRSSYFTCSCVPPCSRWRRWPCF
jgi:hypothetical protein